MTFLSALIFAFVFFGVWSLKDAATAPTSQAALRPLFVGAVFILIAWILTVLPVTVR